MPNFGRSAAIVKECAHDVLHVCLNSPHPVPIVSEFDDFEYCGVTDKTSEL